MHTTRYKEIIKKEIPSWDEEILKKHPEWSKDKIRVYEIKDPSIEDKNIILCSQYVELCSNYKDCHIITMKNEKWVGYYDTKKEIIYIDEMVNNGGVSRCTLEYLTDFLKWDDYIVYVTYYDYEEAVLAIRKRGN